jgi:hypothetical protein
MGDVKLTARVAGRVDKERFATLDEACDALEQRLDDVGRARERSVLGRDYAPGDQIAGRFELKGRGLRAGVDVRGDGSASAYTGRVRKEPVEPELGETALDALRRVLRAPA